MITKIFFDELEHKLSAIYCFQNEMNFVESEIVFEKKENQNKNRLQDDQAESSKIVAVNEPALNPVDIHKNGGGDLNEPNASTSVSILHITFGLKNVISINPITDEKLVNSVY